MAVSGRDMNLNFYTLSDNTGYVEFSNGMLDFGQIAEVQAEVLKKYPASTNFRLRALAPSGVLRIYFNRPKYHVMSTLVGDFYKVEINGDTSFENIEKVVNWIKKTYADATNIRLNPSATSLSLYISFNWQQ